MGPGPRTEEYRVPDNYDCSFHSHRPSDSWYQSAAIMKAGWQRPTRWNRPTNEWRIIVGWLGRDPISRAKTRTSGFVTPRRGNRPTIACLSSRARRKTCARWHVRRVHPLRRDYRPIRSARGFRSFLLLFLQTSRFHDFWLVNRHLRLRNWPHDNRVRIIFPSPLSCFLFPPILLHAPLPTRDCNMHFFW